MTCWRENKALEGGKREGCHKQTECLDLSINAQSKLGNSGLDELAYLYVTDHSLKSALKFNWYY